MERTELFRKSIFHLLGFRGVIAQHGELEAELLKKYASGKKSIMEIGVAEGGSALVLRRAMAQAGTLYLVDPYPSGRIFGLNFAARCTSLC